MRCVTPAGPCTPHLATGPTHPLSLLDTPTNVVCYLDTDGAAPIVSKEDYLGARWRIVNDAGTGITYHTVTGQVRGRGNSTWDQPKKPYKVKLDAKTAVLGMPTSKKWALLANYMDPSLLRNAVAYEIADRAGLAWAPRSRYMDLILNGGYAGLYQWIETVEVDPARCSIRAIKDSDTAGAGLTGGYIVEIDQRRDDPVSWLTRLGVPIIPDTPDLTIGPQQAYIAGIIQSAEDALYDDAFTDPDTGWQTHFDPTSWARWYLLSEVTANNDSVFFSSVKITKDAGDGARLVAGPPWDFDLSLGVGGYFPHPADQWWTRLGATWIIRMLEDPAFQDLLATEWATLKAALLTPQTGPTITGYVAALTAATAAARTRDYALWGRDGGPDIAAWLTSRIAWLDQQLTDPTTTTAPDAPTGLTLTAATPTTLTIGWDYVTADAGAGVIGYRAAVDGRIAADLAWPIGYPGTTSFSPHMDHATLNGLAPGASYTITLQARTVTGGWSTPATIPATTTT